MKKLLSEIALNECIGEIRAACRFPVDPQALETLMSWVRPQFTQLLDLPEGPRHWTEIGQQMRDNGRYLGTFAEFFARHNDTRTVGIDEITRSFEMLRADCTVRSERTPFAWTGCPPVDSRSAEEFLRAVAPTPELV